MRTTVENWYRERQLLRVYEQFRDFTMIPAEASFHLRKGWFTQTLPEFKPPAPIALLRLDADWYDSTMICLEALFNHVASGGLILLDDYYTWDGCSRALHDFLSNCAATERIMAVGDVCYLIKRERALPDHQS